MIYKATSLISECFDAHGIKFRINEMEQVSVIEAGFEIDAGPDVIVRFISKDDDNDVAVRVFGLIHKIPASKRVAMLEACNTLSEKVRFVKFYLASNGDVNVEADLPQRVDDECLGECCVELFIRIMKILNSEYHILAEALYRSTDSDSDAQSQKEKADPLELLKALQSLRDKPINLENTEE